MANPHSTASEINPSPNYPVRDKKRIHRAVAERALGKPLPAGAEVHHVDGNIHNNAPTNLVICQDRAYHFLLHARTRIVRAGGNPATDCFCGTCQTAQSKTEFWMRRSGKNAGSYTELCRTCKNARRRARNAARKAA
jgi:HNH endonuclease